jgi:nicotinamidase-related amidase
MLNHENVALVIIDIQGKLATLMYQKDYLFANAVKMIKGAQTLKIPILWNEQLPDKLGPTIPEIKEVLSEIQPFSKNTFSACGLSAFNERLKESGREQILLMGIEAHVCVYQTALDLLSEGYEVHLVVDAVSSRTAESRQIGISSIHDAGARLTTVEQCLFEILRVAEGDQFKEIIKIVK